MSDARFETIYTSFAKIGKVFMYNITDLSPGNKISGKFYIRPRKPKPGAYHIAELQLARSFSTFCLFFLFYFVS